MTEKKWTDGQAVKANKATNLASSLHKIIDRLYDYQNIKNEGIIKEIRIPEIIVMQALESGLTQIAQGEINSLHPMLFNETLGIVQKIHDSSVITMNTKVSQGEAEKTKEDIIKTLKEIITSNMIDLSNGANQNPKRSR